MTTLEELTKKAEKLEKNLTVAQNRLELLEHENRKMKILLKSLIENAHPRIVDVEHFHTVMAPQRRMDSRRGSRQNRRRHFPSQSPEP